MTLDEVRDLCARSSRDDWNAIHCWGAGSGPSYLSRPSFKVEDGEAWSYSHSMRAAYRPDVSIGLAWGLIARANFQEEWHQGFADRSASSQWVDFLYSGMLIDREMYVVVDGGRANLPLPHRRDERLTITRWQYKFFQMLDGLEKVSDFAGYVDRAGFEVEY